MSKKEKANKNPIPEEKIKKDNLSKREKLTVMTGKNYDIVDISLPNNFFEQIIINEVELSQEFKYEKLNNLVQLYLNAIQYYSSVQPEKVKAYQNRLEFLLTQKETLKNLCKMKSESEVKSKSSNQLQRVRESVKTKFMIQTEGIKKEDIAKKVKIVLNESTNAKEKENKNNIKNILNNEIENQNKKWKEKLNLKRSQMGTRPRLRTSYGGRNFFTPGPITRRSLNIETKVDMNRFDKSGKNMPKFGNIDDDESEVDDNKSLNDGEADFLKMFKERHNREDKKDSDDEGSIIDDNFENDEILMKIEEVEEEEKDDKIKKSEKNVIKDLENKDNIDNKKEISDNKTLKGILKKKDNENNETKEENKETDKKEEQSIEKKDNEENKEIGNNENKKENEEEKKEENEEKKEENEVKKEEENNKDNKINEEKKNDEEENDELGAKNIIHEDGDNILKDKPFQRKKSIVDENILKDIEPDDEIKKIIEEKMEILNNLKDDNNSGDESTNQSSVNLPTVIKKVDIEDIPPVFQETFISVEEKMKEFIGKLNKHFYNDAFEEYSSKLKELYDAKYKKYIDVNNEYYSSIKEKEFLLENEEDLSEEKKAEIQNIIDSLHEEQKDQIDKLIDECNNNIILSMNEFKQNSFRKNVSLQLLEEQLKLDIYTMINEAYYY
jgi:hypothetical protein